VTYKPRAERQSAVGPDIKDRIIDYLCKNAESLYIPKQINSSGDWLNSHKEKGQPLSIYHNRDKVIKWANPKMNTIVLYMLDDGVPQDMIDALQVYCTAFFMNCKVEIKKGGDEWTAGKRLPKDFYAENKIKMRDDRTDPDR